MLQKKYKRLLGGVSTGAKGYTKFAKDKENFIEQETLKIRKDSKGWA